MRITRSATLPRGDVIVWDGGNNDLPFFTPTVHVCLVDPHRVGHESRYHPGEANLRMADAAVIVKEDTAEPDAVAAARAAIRALNPRARIVDTRLPARGSLRETFTAFPSLGPVLPAMGYSPEQIADLAKTIDAVPCDVVLLGTPIDLRRSLDVTRPVARVRYALEEAIPGELGQALAAV